MKVSKSKSKSKLVNLINLYNPNTRYLVPISLILLSCKENIFFIMLNLKLNELI